MTLLGGFFLQSISAQAGNCHKLQSAGPFVLQYTGMNKGEVAEGKVLVSSEMCTYVPNLFYYTPQDLSMC